MRSSGDAMLDDSPNTVVPTVAGATYTASVWVRAPRGRAVKLRLRELRGGSVVRSRVATITGNGGWRQLVVTSAPTAGGTWLSVEVARVPRRGLEGVRRRRVRATQLEFPSLSASPPGRAPPSTSLSRARPAARAADAQEASEPRRSWLGGDLFTSAGARRVQSRPSAPATSRPARRPGAVRSRRSQRRERPRSSRRARSASHGRRLRLALTGPGAGLVRHPRPTRPHPRERP